MTVLQVDIRLVRSGAEFLAMVRDDVMDSDDVLLVPAELGQLHVLLEGLLVRKVELVAVEHLAAGSVDHHRVLLVGVFLAILIGHFLEVFSVHGVSLLGCFASHLYILN